MPGSRRRRIRVTPLTVRHHRALRPVSSEYGGTETFYENLSYLQEANCDDVIAYSDSDTSVYEQEHNDNTGAMATGHIDTAPAVPVSTVDGHIDANGELAAVSLPTDDSPADADDLLRAAGIDCPKCGVHIDIADALAKQSVHVFTAVEPGDGIERSQRRRNRRVLFAGRQPLDGGATFRATDDEKRQLAVLSECEPKLYMGVQRRSDAEQMCRAAGGGFVLYNEVMDKHERGLPLAIVHEPKCERHCQAALRHYWIIVKKGQYDNRTFYTLGLPRKVHDEVSTVEQRPLDFTSLLAMCTYIRQYKLLESVAAATDANAH